MSGKQPYHELSQRHGSPGTPSGTLFQSGILMTLIWIRLCHFHSCLVVSGEFGDSELVLDQSSGVDRVAIVWLKGVKWVEGECGKVLAKRVFT